MNHIPPIKYRLETNTAQKIFEAMAGAKTQQPTKPSHIIIAGMHKTKRINWIDRYADDVKSLEQIFKYLKCEHALKKIVWVNRLGEYKPEKRGNRLVKVVFENERVAKLVRDRAPRLYENNLLGNIIVREDESREARDRRWEARNRSRYAEAEQGSRG